MRWMLVKRKDWDDLWMRVERLERKVADVACDVEGVARVAKEARGSVAQLQTHVRLLDEGVDRYYPEMDAVPYDARTNTYSTRGIVTALVRHLGLEPRPHGATLVKRKAERPAKRGRK